MHNLPKGSKAVTYGWQFSTVVVLPEEPSSGTSLLSQRRIALNTTAIELAFTQLQEIVPQVPAETIIALDRGYDANWLWCRCSSLLIGVLGHIKLNRCLYRVAPELTGKRGAPCKDGAKLQPKYPQTHSGPDDQVTKMDSQGRPVQISWWKRMHVKDALWLEVTVIQVVCPHTSNKEPDPRISWFVWIGDPHADIVEIALGYARRFGQEHDYRFDKQALLWEKPRLRPPEQFERWSRVVAIAHNQLVLARSLVEPELRPWENKQRQSSLQQVRRGFKKLLTRLGTPTRAPQPRGKSKGRSKGVKIGKPPRFPIIRKKPKAPQIVPS